MRAMVDERRYCRSQLLQNFKAMGAYKGIWQTAAGRIDRARFRIGD